MNDIQNQDDLYLLVDEFYKKLLADQSISYIFTDIVKIKIEEHLPILVTFWSQAILGTGGYTNNLTDIHLNINKIEKLKYDLSGKWNRRINTEHRLVYEIDETKNLIIVHSLRGHY